MMYPTWKWIPGNRWISEECDSSNMPIFIATQQKDRWWQLKYRGSPYPIKFRNITELRIYVRSGWRLLSSSGRMEKR